MGWHLGRAMGVTLAAGVLLAGCLGSGYAIERDELLRLSMTDPQTRGSAVRVLQQFATAQEQPHATPVYVQTGVVVDVGPRHAPRGGPSAGGTGNSGQASADADSAAVLIVIAALASVALAATEGARYDGWVQLHPMHPLHLRMPSGAHMWVPLAQLTPELASQADYGVVVQNEGPWQPIARAPLNRVGLTYGVELGAAGLDSRAGDSPFGFMGRIQFGGFPIQEVGILANLGLGWGGNAAGQTVFNARYGLELDLYPATIDMLHFGLYGEIGYAHSSEDVGRVGVGAGTSSREAPYYGGGGLMQVDLTTRLALTLRLGVSRIGAVVMPSGSVGLAIY